MDRPKHVSIDRLVAFMLTQGMLTEEEITHLIRCRYCHEQMLEGTRRALSKSSSSTDNDRKDGRRVA